MSQPIELILVRHLASTLVVPVFVVDSDGLMVFYNEAAEQVLGRRFDDAGDMPFEEWTSIFAIRDPDGELMEVNQIPLVRALRERRPNHVSLGITGLDGKPRNLEVSCFPLEAEGQRHLGAVALFWETAADETPAEGG